MSKQHITSVDQSKINDLKESYDDFHTYQNHFLIHVLHL